MSSLAMSEESRKHDQEREDKESSDGMLGTSSGGDAVGTAASDETSPVGKPTEKKVGVDIDESAAGGTAPPESLAEAEEDPVGTGPGSEDSVPDESAGASADEPAVPASSAGAKATPNEQAAPGKLPDKGAPAEPTVSPSSPTPLLPLAPVTVNGLLEDQMGRVKQCYDVARAKNPGLEGVLRLLVSVEGSRVNATVIQNELTPALASCVMRAVRRIHPPPNDGRLVEIEKEYSFVGTK